MRIKRIECVMHKSIVPKIIDDLFVERYFYGSGQYWVRHLNNHYGNHPLGYFWAATLSGRQLRLRQIKDPLWSFSANFGHSGSAQFAWKVSNTLTLHKTQASEPGMVKDITYWHQY